MFKNSLGGGSAGGAGSGEIVNTNGRKGGGAGPAQRPRSAAPVTRRKRLFLGMAATLLAAGCASVVSPLPPADLKQPGWTVREGQAVWRLAHGAREIAGDVLVATRANGDAFIQFSKTPFPLVIARENAHQWQVEFPPQSKHYAGRGRPPRRVIWLYLPRVLAGEPPPKGWTWHHDASGWQLANGATGESLEGFFGGDNTRESRTTSPPRWALERRGVWARTSLCVRRGVAGVDRSVHPFA